MPFFAICADEPPRAKAFYEAVFGWSFANTEWEGFHLVLMDGQEVGAIEARHELIEGQRTNAFRLTFRVPDIRAALAAVEANGGQVLMTPSAVGGGTGLTVGYFDDGEGNVSGVSQAAAPKPDPKASRFRYFSINADDVQRAKRFYEGVFGWRFSPWGPPDYYQIKGVWPGMMGSLQARRELIPGIRTNALEATFAVDDIRAAQANAVAAGGAVLMQPYLIEGVGEIGYVQDTEGNICGLGQYLPGYWA